MGNPIQDSPSCFLRTDTTMKKEKLRGIMLQFLNLESMKKTEPFCSGINVLLYYSSKKLESFKWQLKKFKRAFSSKFKAFRELHNQDIPSLYACIYSMYACVRERNKVHFTVLQQNFLFLIICKSHHQLNAAVTRASFQSNTAVEFTDTIIHSGEINPSSRLLLSSPEGRTCMAGHD